MFIAVDVGLRSGETVSVEAGLDESAATLKRHAEAALAVGKGRLFDSSARLLDEQQTVKQPKLETGTSLTLQVGKVRIGGNSFALSAILGDGSVVTWGSLDRGGDGRAVQDHLNSVQQIQASERAFAAILTDGSVVTWGPKEYGGDSRAVEHQLKGVQQI